MEVNIAASSLMIIVHGIHREKTVPGTTQENGVRKEEQDNHGACKEYEITCWVSLTVLGML
jgi:hypothetical protein